MTARERVKELIKSFPKVYPNAHTELNFKNPLQLLVATILSAQCTDKRVNMVTPALFKKYRTAKDYADAPQAEFERAINARRPKVFAGPCAQSQRNTVEESPTQWRN
jgi:endonuclease III